MCEAKWRIIRSRFLSPILKPKSHEIFPPSHLTVFYLHSKWLGSPITWRNPKWLQFADLGISWVALTSLFVVCIFFNSFMWHYMVCFTTYLQKAVRILFIDRGLLWYCIQWCHYNVEAWHHNIVDTDAWRCQQHIARKTKGCVPK